MDRVRWLREREADVRRVHGLRVSEVTPSQRDFGFYGATRRQELAVIARIQSVDPDGGRAWPAHDLVAYAVACDDAEVAALAVVTDAQRGGSLALLQSVAAATRAPILRDDLTLHPNQLYDARLHGADAAIFPAAELDARTLTELARVAGSLHMASVIEVQSPADLMQALALPKALIGINADLDTTRRLAREVPADRTVLALCAPDDAAAVRALCGWVDAVIVGAPLLDATDVAATLAALAAG